MEKHEYLTLCSASAALTVQAATLSEEHSDGFRDPIKTARQLGLDALNLINSLIDSEEVIAKFDKGE